MCRSREGGQSLLELIVVVAVVVVVSSALTFAVIASLRNAQFAKNSAQATKLAQEGLEKVRTGRDRNDSILGFTPGGVAVDNWQDPDLWSNPIAANCTPVCYFKLAQSTGGSIQYVVSVSQAEKIGGFTRAIILSDSSTSYTVEKQVSAEVSWSDFSGTHQSKLTTILRKP